jgi:hypothetical protein
MPVSVKALAFPVARRHWVLFAWRLGEADPAEAAAKAAGPGGVQGFVQGLPDRAVGIAQAQWKKLEAAREGTFKNYLYRCAARGRRRRSCRSRVARSQIVRT